MQPLPHCTSGVTYTTDALQEPASLLESRHTCFPISPFGSDYLSLCYGKACLHNLGCGCFLVGALTPKCLFAYLLPLGPSILFPRVGRSHPHPTPHLAVATGDSIKPQAAFADRFWKGQDTSPAHEGA